jgi:hypothetical protein
MSGMYSRIFSSAFLSVLVLCVTSWGAPSHQVKIEPYLEQELLAIEETYRLLDLYANDIWPGWDNYKDIEIEISYPHKIQMLVSPKKDPPEGFELYPARKVFGKHVYLNRKDEISMLILPPLFTARGRGGKTIRLDMAMLKIPGNEADRISAVENKLKTAKDPGVPFDLAPAGDADGHILMLVHEHFHGFQTKFRPLGEGAAGLQNFDVNPEYAAYSHIEGLALKRAYREKNDQKSLEYWKDFMIARDLKREHMPPEAGASEIYISLIEGTPSYCSLKMAQLILDAEYKSGIKKEENPYFFQFNHLDGYLTNIMDKGMDFAAPWTLDKRGKYYLYGAYQCYLLDRFIPGWKKNFLRDIKNLDSITWNFLNLSKDEKEDIAGRIKTRYSFDDIYSHHAAVLKNKRK